MATFKQTFWWAQRRLQARSTSGTIDLPPLATPLGRTLFRGTVACGRPIDDIIFELDGLIHRSVELRPPSNPSPPPGLPHVADWLVVVDVVPSHRGGKRPARLVVNGQTAATAAFTFGPAARPTYVVTPDESSTLPLDRFYGAAASLPAGSRLLEMGTKQAVEGISTHSSGRFPGVARADYVMCDILPGRDVDVVGDLHGLPASWTASFDAFLAHAVFEHLERPWIAAQEVARILKPGGICLVATHQCFPLHGYPSDFFRFSKEALSLIFRDAGMKVLEVAYNSRATITAPAHVVEPAFHEQWNATWPSYIEVAVFASKPS